LLSHTSSILRYLLISIAPSLLVLSSLWPLSCTGQVASEGLELDERRLASTEGVLIAAVGDVMLARNVGDRIRSKDDPKAPFLKTAEILESADISFCNLESPFCCQELPPQEGIIFGAEPETIDGLKYAGFDIVSLANNHFGDQEVAGMYFTLSHLNNNGIEYVGAGENEVRAREPKIIERNGVKFAFLGYDDTRSGRHNGYRATAEKPGVARLTEGNLAQDIREARKMAHVVIVSFHWGVEYEESPTERQKILAHLAIDSGASLVLGHHPHVIQPLEEYKDGYIFYSLGNFVFDQMWSDETRNGLIARIFFERGKITKVEMIEVIICDYHQPRPVIPYSSVGPCQQD